MSNSTGRTLSDWLPVYGLPGYRFYILHVTALVSLGISIVVSTAILVLLRPVGLGFWHRSIGERLVVYLAICDLLYSISHSLDHIHMVAIKNHPPDWACTVYAFFVTTFLLTQAFVVNVIAINACLLVVKNKKYTFGPYDWHLLGTLILPVVVMAPCAAFGLLGQSGPWCIVDMRSQMGHGVTNAMSAVMLLTMATNGLAYLLVWFKIRQVSALMLTAGAAPAGRIVNYHRTARVMTIFVAAYVLQWWPYVVASIWTLIKKHPPVVIYILAVFTCNMGGVFNALAYTILRRRLQASNRASVTSSNIAS